MMIMITIYLLPTLSYRSCPRNSIFSFLHPTNKSTKENIIVQIEKLGLSDVSKKPCITTLNPEEPELKIMSNSSGAYFFPLKQTQHYTHEIKF